MTVLEKILQTKKQEIATLPACFPIRENAPSPLSLFRQLQGGRKQAVPNLIAEFKKASPSQGEIFPEADPKIIAKVYEDNGAAALSCLTDTSFFSGSEADLRALKSACALPVIRKDFIFDARQIEQSVAWGADAILLMVRVVGDNLKPLLQLAYSRNLEVLVEAHNADEVAQAVEAGAQIIGVNARDFRDLSVDISRLPTLLQQIPEDRVRVAESGLSTREDLESLAVIADAVLMGTSLMKLQDEKQIAQKVAQLTA